MGFPTLPPEHLNILWGVCKQVAREEVTDKHATRHHDKQMQQLSRLLHKENKPVLFLKGEPGVGKTYAVRRLLGKYYEGESDVLPWLTDTDKNAVVVPFLGDEANTSPPGAFAFIIKGLSSPRRTVYHQDEERRPPKNAKCILTGNPEDFPGRHYHQAIQDYSETIFFEKPDDEFLVNHAARMLPLHLRKYAPALLFAYHLVTNTTHFCHVYTGYGKSHATFYFSDRSQ